MYQPGLLFIPFGLTKAYQITRPRHEQLRAGIDFHHAAVDAVSLDDDVVHLEDGTDLGYDVLVVATAPCSSPRRRRG